MDRQFVVRPWASFGAIGHVRALAEQRQNWPHFRRQGAWDYDYAQKLAWRARQVEE